MFEKISRKMMESGFGRDWKLEGGLQDCERPQQQFRERVQGLSLFQEVRWNLGSHAATRPPQTLDSSAAADPMTAEEVSSCNEHLNSETGLASDLGGDGGRNGDEETPVLSWNF